MRSDEDISVHSLSLDSLSLTVYENPHDVILEDEGDTEPDAQVKNRIYILTCVRLMTNSATINLNHHGLGPLGAQALAIALVTDMHTTTLELADNSLLAEGARYLTEMLRANFTIHNLVIISTLVSENRNILSVSFQSNYRVKELDLSHNQFSNNDGLEVLDLSWNHLRMKAAVAFCAGLKVNTTLKHLDLSFNGFGNEGALALGEALKFNNTLVHLDLNNNCMSDEGASLLCKGLEANDTLRVLQVRQINLLQGALTLVSVVKNTPKMPSRRSTYNVLVNENFVQLLELICLEHPSLEVHYGGVGGFIAKKPCKRVNPMKVIQDYLDQRKLRLWDFFRNIDKDGTMRVPVVDFRKAVQIEQLTQRLDRDRTGIVDYR
uniref:Leucine rich repeat containing 74A n=1 Tax=Sinocyclocheilus rhinocerous TaxID=307959 RepID=A0A673K4C7_9TELE